MAVTCSCGAAGFHLCTAGERHQGTLLKDAADAAARERRATMPDPVRTARRGIIAGRHMGLSERHAAMMVMSAASAAEASAQQDGAFDTAWLQGIHAEAERVYLRTLPDAG